MKIPHSRPFFDAADEEIVIQTLRNRYVSSGDNVDRLGTLGATVVGKQWGIPTQSGTDALTAALRLLVPERGKRVVVPAYVCAAPLDALALLGLEPVPVDVERETMALNPDLANRERNVSAVLIAHLFGVRAPSRRIRHENLVEDCAQTLSVPGTKNPVGSVGRLSICSFYATKLLTTGHGGLLAGDGEDDRRRADDLFQHDKRDAWEPRFHFLMSDFNAALGISQIEKLPRFLNERRNLAKRYLVALGEADGLAANGCSRFLVLAPDGRIEEIIQRFHNSGIEAKRPVCTPLYQYLGLDHSRFPNARWIHDHVVSVPLHPGMTEEEVETVESFLKENRHDLRRWPPA